MIRIWLRNISWRTEVVAGVVDWVLIMCQKPKEHVVLTNTYGKIYNNLKEHSCITSYTFKTEWMHHEMNERDKVANGRVNE